MTTRTTTLAEFLLARIAEDEALARGVDGGTARPIELADYTDGNFAFLEGFTPARVLAECEAKRRIVELHRLRVVTWPKAYGMQPFTELLCTECGQEDNDQFVPTDWPCPTLRLLALPYADHSEWREEWRP